MQAKEKLVWEVRERKIVITFCGQGRLTPWRQRSWCVLDTRPALWVGGGSWGALERLPWSRICFKKKCQRQSPEEKQRSIKWSEMTARMSLHNVIIFFKKPFWMYYFANWLRKTIIILWENTIFWRRRQSIVIMIISLNEESKVIQALRAQV